MRYQVHALGKTLAAGLLLLAASGVDLTDVTADADAADQSGDDATAKVFYRSLAQQADSQAQTAASNAPASTSNQSTDAADGASTRLELRMKRRAGLFTVPIEINGKMTLDFVVDSGAAFVTVPADVLGKLREAGAIRESDLHGNQRFTLADGSLREGMAFTIRSLRAGDKLFENVQGIVVPVGGQLLLGQTFLECFKSWSLDNINGKLTLELLDAADWWRRYQNQIIRILSRNQSHLADTASRHEEGTALVTFTVERSGLMTERHIVRSTGSFTLDQAVLGLLDRSQPFPPFPATNSQKEVTLIFPIGLAIGPKESATKDSAAKDSVAKESATTDSATKESATKQSASKGSATKGSATKGSATK
jgi:TonB family protein